ncbi:MAG TPA: 50S ribosomal protein L17 [Clostridiaceae bacterium]|jgi:large subunit ribosomal protein L17|nr:50S ribosomal protein L17 [Clostridiaceae bacterium]
MGGYRKLGRTSDQRHAMLRGLVTSLIVNGKVQTTDTRAKEVRRIAEKLITAAVREQDNFTLKEVPVSSAKLDAKGRKILRSATSKNGAKYDVVERELKTKQVQVDKPSRLAARREIMKVLYEHHTADGKRVNSVNYLFSDIAPKYRNRQGGYTRIIKIGPRRGDAADMVLLELV